MNSESTKSRSKGITRTYGLRIVLMMIFLGGMIGCAGTHSRNPGDPSDPLQVIHVDGSSPDYIHLRNTGSQTLDLRNYKLVESKNSFTAPEHAGDRVFLEPNQARRIFFISPKQPPTMRKEWVKWITGRYPDAMVCDEWGLSTGERVELWNLNTQRLVIAVRVP